MTVRQIAEFLGAPVEGAEDREVSGVAALESAGPGDVAFLRSRKSAMEQTLFRAGCLIVPLDHRRHEDQTIIRTAEPRAAFARVIRLFHPLLRAEPGIHPTAFIAVNAEIHPSVSVGAHASIAEGARIGAGSSIGPSCAIGKGARLGEAVILHPNVTVYDGVVIGSRVILHAGCVLGADGFGFVLTEGRYEKFPQVGGVQLGDDVEIGANSCVDRAALGVTSIGDGTKLDNLVHVGHNCTIGKHVVVAAQTGFSGGVVVEDYAVIGGQVGIGDKARIESRAVLGSGSGVLTSKIIRSGQVVWGTPARLLKDHLEQLANLSRLPKLRRQVLELLKRVDKLEQTD